MEWKILSLAITVCHHLTSFKMPNDDPLDGFFYPTLTLMIDSYILCTGLVQTQTQNKVRWLAACGHMSASSQSLRFILSLRMNSSFITLSLGFCYIFRWLGYGDIGSKWSWQSPPCLRVVKIGGCHNMDEKLTGYGLILILLLLAGKLCGT